MVESWLAEELVCDSSVDIRWKVGSLRAAGLTTRHAGGPLNRRLRTGKTQVILYHTHIRLWSPRA